MNKKVNIPPIFYILTVIFAILLPLLNHLFLGYFAISESIASEESFNLLQNIVIPFISTITLFLLYGTIIFTVTAYGTVKSLPFLLLSTVSLVIPYAATFYLNSRINGYNIKDLYYAYSDMGYTAYIFTNIVINIITLLSVFAISLIVANVYIKKYGYNKDITGNCKKLFSSSDPLLVSLIISTVVAFIPEFINDVVTTANDLIEVGLPENANEVLYLAEPYISIIIYAVCGFFTMRVISLFYGIIHNNSLKKSGTA